MWSIYHVVVCPIVADVRVTHGHEGGLIDHRQPDGKEENATEHQQRWMYSEPSRTAEHTARGLER